MIKFLTQHPIGVSMSFLALVLAGLVSAFRLPVSLMPDIDIPEITVTVQYDKASIREINSEIIKPLKHQLLQLNHLKQIEAEAKNGRAVLTLYFEHGTKTDYAFIEVNERIERAMDYLPRDTERPMVTKKSVGDIPVFYLHCKYKEPKNDFKNKASEDKTFDELSGLVSHLIKKRIEQLDEIAVADISGTSEMQIRIIPDLQKMQALGISSDDIAGAISSYNFSADVISFSDNQFRYRLKTEQHIRNINQIKELYFKKNDKIFQLKDFADISPDNSLQRGATFYNKQQAVTLALIKQPNTQTAKLTQNLNILIESLENDYPEISFDISRNQTKILDHSVSNVKYTVIIGGLLAFLVLFVFIRNIRIPIIIGLSIPVSVVISFLFFDFAGLSLNIISLSGLTLGIGMMIDNAIIVTDNINRYQAQGRTDACITGTNEVIRPLLSSTLTTIAIFLPLSLLSGKAGALFYEQAMAITVTLSVSFFVSIMLLPVLYSIVQKTGSLKLNYNEKFHQIEKLYDKTSHIMLRNQKIALAVFFLFIASGIFVFYSLPKEVLPNIEQNNFSVNIDPGEQISLQENIKRSKLISELPEGLVSKTVIFAGEQDFMVNREFENDIRQANIYFEVYEPKKIPEIKRIIKNRIKSKYPESHLTFSEKENILKKIFSGNMPDLEVRLRPLSEAHTLGPEQVGEYLDSLKQLHFLRIDNKPSFLAQTEIIYDTEKMMLYGVSSQEIKKQIRLLSGNNHLAEIKTNNEHIPINSAPEQSDFFDLINKASVSGEDDKQYPLKEFITLNYISDLKSIRSDNAGEYFPVSITTDEKNIPKLENRTASLLNKLQLKQDYTGSIFENKALIKEFAFVLMISFLLLYFILAAQFESFVLPLIILAELPADIVGAFLFLKLFGVSINLMSLTGIIVMAGIIINDSILKIDTMNQLTAGKASLLRAIKKAGHIRLKQILMTSITTVLAVTPFLFFSGMGSDLQKPLAIALSGGMITGTFVSLFFIPLFYLMLRRITIKR
jgi:multidrug efflux pump subunit AcrB